MMTLPMSRLNRCLRNMAMLQDGGGMTDRQLLEGFLTGQNEAAFAALMRRHSPMVFGVCRRVLHNSQDAEDAFQATFLVLVRKARSVRRPELLGNWLYGVAYRIALAARGASAKRRVKERTMAKPEAVEECGCNELAALLDKELVQLPEKYRVPIVLCDLEGKTRKDVARQLGCPEGTISGRLSRGRAILARRLSRHGPALSGGAIAAVLAQQAASAGVPAGLAGSTLTAATVMAAGTATAAELVSAKVVALTEGMVKTMLMTKLKIATALVLLAVGSLIGAIECLPRSEAKAVERVVAAPVPPEPAQAKPAQAKSDQEKLQGTWNVVAAQIFGKDVEGEEGDKIRKQKVIFEGDKMTMRHGGKFTLNVDKKPKELDLELKDGPENEQGTWRGIYDLRGDDLTIVLAMPKVERPTEFKTEAKVPHIMFKLKRVKSQTSDVQAPTADEPVWKKEFRAAYGLREGELIRRIAPPYPECRAEYFRDRMREAYKRFKIDPPAGAVDKDQTDFFTKFGWRDGWPADELSMQTTPVKPDQGVRLVQLIRMTTGHTHTRTEGDADLLERQVTGDFVVRAGADPEKIAAALEKTLRKECDLPVALAVQEVERDVYVLSGKYQAKPLPDRNKNLIEVYGFELTDRTTGGGGSGTLVEMADNIEGFIGSRIAIGEVKDAPKKVEWHFNYRSPFTAEQRVQDTDAQAVMANISAQTGLAASLEKRKVKVLVVTMAK